VTSSYTNRRELASFIDRSLSNLGVDTSTSAIALSADGGLLPSEVFDAMDTLSLSARSASTVCGEKVEEALKAIEYPNVVSVQIIYNMFVTPCDLFFRAGQKKKTLQSLRECLWRAACLRQRCSRIRFSRQTTIVLSIAMRGVRRRRDVLRVPYDIALKAVDELRALYRWTPPWRSWLFAGFSGGCRLRHHPRQ